MRFYNNIFTYTSPKYSDPVLSERLIIPLLWACNSCLILFRKGPPGLPYPG